MTGTYLFLVLIFSSIGLGFFVYGKKQRVLVPLICGVLLMIYPYFVTGILPIALIGVALMAIPYFVRV
jgi:hypothetical protein